MQSNYILQAATMGDAAELTFRLGNPESGSVHDVEVATGLTALHHASAAASAECVKILLEAKADVNAKDDLGQTPLVICSCDPSEGAAECAKLLVAAGSEPVPPRRNPNPWPF